MLSTISEFKSQEQLIELNELTGSRFDGPRFSVTRVDSDQNASEASENIDIPLEKNPPEKEEISRISNLKLLIRQHSFNNDDTSTNTSLFRRRKISDPGDSPKVSINKVPPLPRMESSKFTLNKNPTSPLLFPHQYSFSSDPSSPQSEQRTSLMRKISGLESDQMVSLSFRSLETYISEDNLAGLQAYLASRSVLIDDRDENGATALIVAATRGKTEFVNEFIRYGADINAEDNDQWSALICASKEGHNDVVATLLDRSANIHQKDIGGWTALMWASYKGHSNIALQLLGAGSDPNTQGVHHMTSLVWAAGRGHTDIAQALIQHKAKVNIGDKFGTTPLIWACRKGYYEIAEALLKNGANVDASGMYSWTSLLVATRGNFSDLVHLILDYKPHLNALDKDGGTALTIACKEGYTEIAVALLNAGAYVNMQDRNGDSNLIYAARGGHRAVVEALMKKYADVEVMGKERKNALYWSIEKGHTSVVKILLSSNPDLEHTTKDGDTVLLRAVRSKNAEVVQMLVDKKARVSVADKKGDTALHIAMRGRSKRIVEILLRNPKNSQMLYRPNRAGETPYNMDMSNQKTIMGQIFGARRLNTNEDNENMLGYDLYSSAMADILSEPSLSMPISVGLYAKWGSGKSFLLKKLKEEMGLFAKQWVEPLFQFSPLVFLLVIHLTVVAGLITAVPTLNWHIGLATASTVFIICTIFLIAVWYGARRYDWPMWFKWSVSLERYMAALKLVLQVIFCSPPGPNFKDWKDGVQARPLKYIFADGAKPSSTAAGENAVVQMIGSLYDMLEREYGVFSTRFYRAFRPRAHSSSSSWRYRRLCCMPYIVIFFVTLICTLTAAVLASLFGFSSVLYPEAAAPVEPDALTRTARATVSGIGDFEDEDEDESKEVFDSGEDMDDSESGNQGFLNLLPYHQAVMLPLLITLGVLVAVVIIANLSTLARMFRALIFSHRRHLLRSVAKLDTLKAEGYLHTLKGEVNLMIEMVKCLDAFTSQQTRLVVVVDGLDSCEQEKVLAVLDAVHMLFTDSNAPFIILLAIDPHIITKAIELHVHRVFSESSISGHDYLRNIVHLPFYLQNSGLRKVKLAQQAADRHKGKSQSAWTEAETDIASTSGVTSGMSNRKYSGDGALSASQMLRRNKSTKSLRPNDSIASSIASNLNRVGGAQDLTKVLLTDDYFSEINPRSMRRLMNVVYITGRLLKAFHIDFNWYHLASWINITEQWPYRASWLILYFEANNEHIEDKLSLKELYEKVKGKMPNSKEMEPLLELDKDEKKFDIFLSMHKSSLHIMDLTIFLPFTINLDPYIRKVIKEGQSSNFDGGLKFSSSPATGHHWPYTPLEQNTANHVPPPQLTRRVSHLNQIRARKESTNSLPSMNQMMWGYGAPPYGLPYGPPSISSAPSINYMHHTLSHTLKLPADVLDKKLSELNIEGLFEVLSKIDGISKSSLPAYKERLIENNINGKVLMHCDMDDLKKVVVMNFGDWELFRVLVCTLREKEIEEEYNTKNIQFQDPSLYENSEEDHEDSGAGNSASSAPDALAVSKRGTSNPRSEENYSSSRKSTKQQNLIAKQVTMEEQLIFGALQTLNEEACEDVLDEQEYAVSGSPKQMSTEEFPEMYMGDLNGCGDGDDMGVLYLQSSPLMSHKVITNPPSEAGSGAASLVSAFSPYKLSSRRSSRCASTGVSPKHSSEKTPSLHSPSLQQPQPILWKSSLKRDVINHEVSPAKDSRESSPTRQDKSQEFSLVRKVTLPAISSPLRRDRPLSLNLGKSIKKLSDSVIDYDMDDTTNDSDVNEMQASLPDLPEAVAESVFRNPSLSDQFSASSIEKLRKLKTKLHRALGVPEGGSGGRILGPGGSIMMNTSEDDAECSPLVIATPPGSLTSHSNISPCLTPDGGERVRILSRQERLSDSSYLPLIITTRQTIPGDRETHV